MYWKQMNRVMFVVIAFALFSSVACGQSIDASPKTSTVRVMSFNIRYGTAKDGENHWDHRKDFLIETIQKFAPDLLGTQETLGFQRDYLGDKLLGYERLGIGRNNGKEEGEMMALYFRKSRFNLLESGHFWLSETPDQIGSKSWDAALPRMVTWVRLAENDSPTALPILFLNTHFDHMGTKARIESAKLLRSKTKALSKGARMIVTGDFNAGSQSEPYKTLFEKEESKSFLVDTYVTKVRDSGGHEGTFSGFQADKMQGPRIDWIAVSADWKVLSADIDRTSKDGRTPSDHFPVTAILE